MTLENLDNLVKLGQLKIEPRDQAEFEGHSEMSSQLLKELIDITEELLRLVEALKDRPG